MNFAAQGRLPRVYMASAVLLLASVSAMAPAQADATPAATAIVPVSESTDTAEEFLEASLTDSERWPANYSYATSSDLELAFDLPHGPQLNAVRFTGLVVPDGSWVEHAEVVFTADGNSSGPLTLVVYGEASDAAEPFVQDPDGVGTGDLSSRPATAAPSTGPRTSRGVRASSTRRLTSPPSSRRSSTDQGGVLVRPASC